MAPLHAAGFPRLPGLATSCSRRLTVRPDTCTTSRAGGSAGGGMGDGVARTVSPSSSRWASVTVGQPCTISARDLDAARSVARAAFLDDTDILFRTPGSTAARAVA